MIGVLIFPDFQLLDASGPISTFGAGRFPEVRLVKNALKRMAAGR